MDIKITIGIGAIFLVVGLICYWAIKALCDKKATDYFNANMKDHLQNIFNGYKGEIIEHLEDMKKFKEFKISKILILNDTKNFIHNIAFFANFENKVVVNQPKKIKNINNYSIVIINASNNNLAEWDAVISTINNTTPILVYTDNNHNIDLGILKDSGKIFTPVNNKFTLIDRLYTSYLITKITGDRK